MKYLVRVQKDSKNQVVNTMKLVGFDYTGMPSFVSESSSLEPMRFDNNDWEKTILNYLVVHWSGLTSGPSFEYKTEMLGDISAPNHN